MSEVYLDRFDSTMDLKKLTYEAVKERVVEAGRFSIFEATSSHQRAKIFDQIERDPELVCTPVEYPWVKVERVKIHE
jgi:hypothetical protein